MALLSRKKFVSIDDELDSALQTAGNALTAFTEAADTLDAANDALDGIKARSQDNIASLQAAIKVEEQRVAAAAGHQVKNSAAASKIREIFA